MGASVPKSSCLELTRRALRALAVLAVVLTAGGTYASAPARAQATAEPQVVAIVLNAVLVAEAAVIYSAGPGWWMDAEQLARWRLRPEGDEQRSFEGRVHRRICASPEAGVRCAHDEATAILDIQADPGRFDALRLGLQPGSGVDALPVAAPVRGVFANYDLVVGAGGSAEVAAQIDARAYPGIGEFYLQAGAAASQGGRRLLNRLWGWTHDLPEQGWTVTAGGFVGGAATPAAGLALFGLRWASQRSLQPDRQWTQRPLAFGEVAQSSRAELFVDGMYRRSAEIPYGTFSFEADALRPGAGQLQVVTTDAAGRKTVRVQDYYVAPQLLPPGTAEHALEVGAARRDISRPGTRGPLLAAGEYRRGLDADTTLSTQALYSSSARLLGASIDRGLGLGGVLRAGLSVVDRAGSGAQPRWLLAHDYQSERWSSVVRAEMGRADRSDPFAVPAGGANRELQGLLALDRRHLLASGMLTLTPRHQLSASLSDRIDSTGKAQRLASLNLTWQAANRMQVMASVQNYTGAVRYRQAMLTVVLPLGARHLGTMSASSGSRGPVAQWTVQSVPDPREALQAEPPPSYRVYGEFSRKSYAGASVWADTRYGQWELDASSGPGDAQVRGRFSGALGWMAGATFFGRRMDDSFIVVDTDGHADVPVFLENRPAGRTNAQGRLLVTGARPWQNNRISVDGASLPIDATLAQDQVDVRPRGRSGAFARFEIGDGGELVQVRLADGKPVPAGARAVVSSQAEPAVVGSRSEVFIQRAGRKATVQITWSGGTCRFDYVPAGEAVTPATGEGFTCR